MSSSLVYRFYRPNLDLLKSEVPHLSRSIRSSSQKRTFIGGRMLQILARRWPTLVRVDHFLFYLWRVKPLGSFEFQMARNLIFLRWGLSSWDIRWIARD